MLPDPDWNRIVLRKYVQFRHCFYYVICTFSSVLFQTLPGEALLDCGLIIEIVHIISLRHGSNPEDIVLLLINYAQICYAYYC